MNIFKIINACTQPFCLFPRISFSGSNSSNSGSSCINFLDGITALRSLLGFTKRENSVDFVNEFNLSDRDNPHVNSKLTQRRKLIEEKQKKNHSQLTAGVVLVGKMRAANVAIIGDWLGYVTCLNPLSFDGLVRGKLVVHYARPFSTAVRHAAELLVRLLSDLALGVSHRKTANNSLNYHLAAFGSKLKDNTNVYIRDAIYALYSETRAHQRTSFSNQVNIVISSSSTVDARISRIECITCIYPNEVSCSA